MNKTETGMEGYIMDLLAELSQHTSLDFTTKIVADGQYGEMEGHHWTGMIGELVNEVSMDRSYDVI